MMTVIALAHKIETFIKSIITEILISMNTEYIAPVAREIVIASDIEAGATAKKDTEHIEGRKK